ncbi:DUF374 domain-containing protein [Pendulispora brunnea]|uniref:DUF374 domain-containing protein n=1 Tax=Pendulispora brunnea TaxID=2905690 RepID=A0ABZ2KK47_9BACT
MRAVMGLVLGLVAALWLKTLRVRILVDPRLHAEQGPWVLSFFHGTQFPLLVWKRRRRTVVMVSHSQDGAMQARALGLLGFTIVRGSSSRGGVRGLAAMIRTMKRDRADAAFAVDGPRGPYGKVKEGALLSARATGGVLVPMGSASARAWIATRAWDKFALPLPFSRVQVVLGAPLHAPTAEQLEAGIAAANETANAMVNAAHAPASSRLSEPLPPRESPPHGDGIRELQVPAMGNTARDT